MSKHLSGFRTHAAYAMDCIRGEGWTVRRIAIDVWKVSDRRRRFDSRWQQFGLKRRHFLFNHAQLLDFSGVSPSLPLGREPYVRPKMHVLSDIWLEDEDLPF